MKKLKKIVVNSQGFGHIELFVVIVVVIVILFVGSYVFQSNSDASFKTNVEAAYRPQAAEMKLVYASFARPVFSNNNSTQQSDNADLSYINAVIKSADNKTATLASKSSLITIPIVSSIGSSSTVSKEHKSMETYVSDSKTFLADYQQLSTYYSAYNRIANNQLGTVFSDFNAYSNDTTVAQITASVQTTSAALTTAINDFKSLSVPVDFQKLNSEIISDLTNMNTDLKNIDSALNGQNGSDLTSALTKFQTDTNNLQSLANYNVAGMLEGNSHIHQQIKQLEAQNPLGNNL